MRKQQKSTIEKSKKNDNAQILPPYNKDRIFLVIQLLSIIIELLKVFKIFQSN